MDPRQPSRSTVNQSDVYQCCIRAGIKAKDQKNPLVFQCLGRTQYGCQPKNRATKPPKWMVKIMEHPYFLMDDLGEKPLFLETPIYNSSETVMCFF